MLTLGSVPQLPVVPSQTQKPVIKAEGEGQSVPLFKPDNTENGLLGRGPSGLWPLACIAALFAAYLAHPTSRLTPCSVRNSATGGRDAG
ncbi:hypothetical protein [Serratia sp. UGAL515B_01]|uniref:hypothetical protein n=1 Tax=Serratia sp. UGAL515B_01 TaxID=2986763 RepID=UPI002955D9ED|nr:hypothetical protein [Serratia sp. UGAL515B_01]WON76483.1 hypothetical protein OK023_14885 [Serratia sp. UGAL515B_01]